MSWKDLFAEMVMELLKDQVALVTGGASGIGRAAALRFAAEGARVAIVDTASQAEMAGDVTREIQGKGGEALFLPCDVKEPEQVQQAVDRTVRRFGRLTTVLANAGINGVWAPLEELQPADWDKTIEINLRGTYLTMHYAIPELRKSGGGSVIVTSSVNGNRSFASAGAAAYSTSKAGQVALMKMAALELARYNIRVNAVLPGAIHTHIQERTEKRNTEKVAVKVELPSGKPGIHGGQGEPEDVADTCVFLASALSRHVSGVELYVDGGASLLM
jgi:NAD(P)-dependent dehydrogenase (short-subunit alcohol dehydrogenase family)